MVSEDKVTDQSQIQEQNNCLDFAQDEEAATITEDEKEEIVGIMREELSMYSGPIPSPQTLQEYNQIDPTFAERIMKMAENQASHRQNMERIMIKSSSRDSLLGVIFGFIIGMTCIISSYFLGVNGQAFLSGVIGVGGLGGLVSVFIYGTRADSQDERNNKNDSE